MPDEEPVEEPSPTLVRMLVDALGEAPGEASVTGPVVRHLLWYQLIRLPTMIGDAEVDVAVCE